MDEAERNYRAILRRQPVNFDALYRLGLLLVRQSRFAEAESMFRGAVNRDRRSADARHHLAVALTGLQRTDEAIRQYKKALSLRPGFAEAHNNLGFALQQRGDLVDAVAQYEKAIAARSDYPEARNNLGTALAALGRHEEATAQYLAAIALRPDYGEAHRGLADSFGVQERYEAAAEHYRKVLDLHPANVEVRIALGNTLHRLDRIEEAIAQYQRALELAPTCVEAHTSLGNTLHRLGRSQEAIGHFQQAIAADPVEAKAHAGLGAALVASGRLSEARHAFEKAIALAPRQTALYWNLASCGRLSAGDKHFLAMKELAATADSLDVADQISLHFALGKAFSDTGDRRQSFQHFLKGNSLKRKLISYDESKVLERLERIRSVFTPELMRDRRGMGDPAPVPVFIVGMPRSGTTLIEQILASHPQVFGSGELRTMGNVAGGMADAQGNGFPEAVPAMSAEQLRGLGTNYVQAVKRLAPEANRITDKMPANFSLVGLIHLALPNARIIHACRDPRDTALSCFSLLFAGDLDFTYDLGELGRYVGAYLRLMAHWRDVIPGETMLEVRYEDVVHDLEGQARRIVAHCGLPWDAACLDFHRTERSVLTASAAQVRQPIYQSAIGRWREYADELQPFLAALEGCQAAI